MVDQENVLQLSALTNAIGKVIAANFQDRAYWVIAETTNLKFYPAKGYYFMDLVEKDPSGNSILACIKASAWSQAVKRISYFERITGQKFDNNIKVLLQVTVEYHISFGLRLNILDINPAFTIGNLEQQKQQTLLRLVADNPGFIQLSQGEYRTLNKTLLLNAVIQNIALIASPGSDGYKDFVHELENNNFGYRFNIDEYPAQVQGIGMEIQLVKRLVDIFTSGKVYDAVVIVRGGGAQTDFLNFDSYELSRAVAKFPIPVFTGIGHTRNETIVDKMAFRPTKTPTKVAETIIAHNRLFEERMESLGRTIANSTAEMLYRNRTSILAIQNFMYGKSKEIINHEGHKLNFLQSKISQYALLCVKHSRTELLGYTRMISQLSPQTVLKRGFAMLYQDGRLVTKIAQLNPDSAISTILQDGSFESENIKSINAYGN